MSSSLLGKKSGVKKIYSGTRLVLLPDVKSVKCQGNKRGKGKEDGIKKRGGTTTLDMCN